MLVTAKQSFVVPNLPAFEEGKEYDILPEIAKQLLERGLVEPTVVNVTKLDEPNRTSRKSPK